MLFFEPIFLVFFAVIFPLNYLLRGNFRLILLLGASYYFYSWWDWRFLGLLLLSTGVDYIAGLLLSGNRQKAYRVAILMVSIVVNLTILGTFKYFNFFVENFYLAFNIPEDQRFFWSIVLPPGISFYTFQSLAYTIDVYRGKAHSIKNPILFATYVSFFPQLVAGPIERPERLAPQLARNPKFKAENLYWGLRLFLSGCFKKLVIADHVAKISDPVFNDPSSATTVGLWVAALAFAIQIYCDFSGYTDMARGIAKALGVNLSRNFNLPYFAESLNNFWRRWHMTLSYWLRDYVYIPLGGSRHGIPRQIIALFITFGLSGLWHGAAWTFVLWGILHAAWIVAEMLAARMTSFRPPKALAILVTFVVVVLLWVLFRSQSMAISLTFYSGMFGMTSILFNPNDLSAIKTLAVYTLPLVVFSIWQLKTGSQAPDLVIRNRAVHGMALGLVAIFIVLFGAKDGGQFIYFQF